MCYKLNFLVSFSEVFNMSQPEITREIQNSGTTLTLEVERYEKKSLKYNFLFNRKISPLFVLLMIVSTALI